MYSDIIYKFSTYAFRHFDPIRFRSEIMFFTKGIRIKHAVYTIHVNAILNFFLTLRYIDQLQ